MSGELMCDLAELNLMTGRVEEAQSLARSALALAQRAHAPVELAMALAVCGQVESRKGDFIAWRERFREAWALLAKAASPWPALCLLAWQAEAYDRHGDADQARATREEMERVRGGVVGRSDAPADIEPGALLRRLATLMPERHSVYLAAQVVLQAGIANKGDTDDGGEDVNVGTMEKPGSSVPTL